MPDFRAIISQQLAAIDATNPAERNVVYERVKDVLQKAIERSQDQSKLLDHIYELDQVVNEIESGYAKAPSRFDQLLNPVRNLSTQVKLKYGAIAGLISAVADFVKPLLELTVPIIIISAIGGIVLFLGFFLTKRSRPVLQSGALLCVLLFLFSSGWWGLQHLVRNADANGALAEILPGASAVQNAFLARLGRIEAQTRRVGDLLEEQARRSAEQTREAAAMDEEYKRKEREEEDVARQRIVIAGYKPDAEGLVRAFKDNSDITNAFDTLRIEPTEAAVKAVASKVQTVEETRNLANLIRNRGQRLPAMQKLQQSLDADGTKLSAAFQEANAQATVCNQHNYLLAIGPDVLKKACALNGLRFAEAFAKYFSAAHKHLDTFDFMRKATSSLPVEKVAGTIWPGQIKSCGYYEGELDYFHRGSFVRPPYGTISTPNSANIIDVWNSTAEEFGAGSQNRCALNNINAGRARFCRARVIIATPCGEAAVSSVRIIENLATLR